MRSPSERISSVPLVSILIPCRDAGRWLRPCVESALAQTHPRVEVIVFDDGSTDGCANALTSPDLARVRLLRGPGEGGNVARNKLLAAATGEWVQFLDADDYLEPGKIAAQLAEAGERLPAIDVLYSPVWEETWADGRPVSRVPSRLDVGVDLFTQWIAWQLPQTGGPLWRKRSLEALGGWKPDQPCCQEHELYLRSLKTGQRWIHCPSPHAVYRIWSEQTVCRRDPLRVIRERTRLIDDLLAWLESQGRRLPAHSNAAGQAFFEMARTWAKHDPACAARYAQERRARGLLRARGPAAPATYRLVFHTLGLRAAEAIARFRRG